MLRKHVERIVVGGDGGDGGDGGGGGGGSGKNQEVRELKLGVWIGNQRSRIATLSSKRVEQLSTTGMRWT
ncbi:hypothetical protein [Streptomyces sp. NBC_00057]|uniref:hypothetical protein n=1 Tax=Streptomyces sp. NBC_00057 TaxID=2975634 RepID=UPI00324EECFD